MKMNGQNDSMADMERLSYDEVITALEQENEAVLAVVSEHIIQYAERVGELLKEGKDYLPLLTPTETTPPLHAVAMEIVLETIEEELENEMDEDE